MSQSKPPANFNHEESPAFWCLKILLNSEER